MLADSSRSCHPSKSIAGAKNFSMSLKRHVRFRHIPRTARLRCASASASSRYGGYPLSRRYGVRLFSELVTFSSGERERKAHPNECAQREFPMQSHGHTNEARELCDAYVNNRTSIKRDRGMRASLATSAFGSLAFLFERFACSAAFVRRRCVMIFRPDGVPCRHTAGFD